jgi:hypothetical protein
VETRQEKARSFFKNEEKTNNDILNSLKGFNQDKEISFKKNNLLDKL